MNSYADSIKISDREVEDYISQLNNKPGSDLKVNIIEILTDNIDDAEKILDELNGGKNFKELVSIYNKRTSTQNKVMVSGVILIQRSR